MASEFIDGYAYDAEGYFEYDVPVQKYNGTLLMPENVSLECPWGAESDPDSTVFYRLVDGKWTTEKKPTCGDDLLGVEVSHTSQTAHDIKMRAYVQMFADGERFREKRGVDNSWMLEKIPEKTEEEKLAEAAEQIRSKRDSLISDSDYLLASDYPISAKDLEVVKAYRQALRDVPQQEGFPLDVVWPELPSILANK